MTIEQSEKRSRRSLLAGAVGTVLGVAAGTIGRPWAASAAEGQPLLIGQPNDAGAGNTSLRASSRNSVFRVDQTAPDSGGAFHGTAIIGAAGYFESEKGVGILSTTKHGQRVALRAENIGDAFANGHAIHASGHRNHGLLATTSSHQASAIRARHDGPENAGPTVHVMGHRNAGVVVESALAPGIMTNGTIGLIASGSEYAAQFKQRVRVASHVEVEATSDPGLADAGTARIFTRANPRGKLEVCVRFPSGEVQVLATEGAKRRKARASS